MNIKTKMSKLRETAINTLVMPQLEYASAVWDPHTKVMTSQIEQVQRKAARLIVSNYDWQVSATKIVQDIQVRWRALEQRRTDARLCLFYKVIYRLVAIPLPDLIQYSNRISMCYHFMTFRQVSTLRDY